MSDKKVSAFVVKRFKDAGTGNTYNAGDIATVSEGEFANYAGGGLVREPTAEEKKAGEKKPSESVKTTA